MHLNQLLFLSDSKPTSSNGFFWELVIASYGQRDVVFNSLNFTTERIILIIFWLIIYHIHHSQDWALQKNGRLLIKSGARKNVLQLTNDSNTLFGFIYLWCLDASSSSTCTSGSFWVNIWSTLKLLNWRRGWYILLILLSLF